MIRALQALQAIPGGLRCCLRFTAVDYAELVNFMPVLLKPTTNEFERTPADLGVDAHVDRGPVAEALPS